MKPVYRIAVLAALVALTACGGGYDRSRLGFNGPHVVASPFNKYLAREYGDISRAAHTSLISRIFGSVDARKHFARKSAAAADGVPLVPEMPGDWAQNGADFAELSKARADLMEILDNGGRDLVPSKSALAQAQFDCWATGQERTRNNDSLCKLKFKKALQTLQASLDTGTAPASADGYASGAGTAGSPFPASSSAAEEFPPPITSAASASAPGYGAGAGSGAAGGGSMAGAGLDSGSDSGSGSGSGSGTASGSDSGSGTGSAAKGALAPVQQAMFIVFFDWDKATLSSSANDVMDAIAEELKARQDVKKISVIGHADTSGGEKYNQSLSLKRAHAVRDAIEGRGTSASKIGAEGRGEGDLLVRTPDNVREPGNRRVQITLE